MLTLIQTLHTAIAIWNIGCLLCMNYCHAAGKWTPFLKVAYISILIEAIAIIPFGFVCPVRLLVDKWYSPETADILIPYHIAVWIMPVGMGLLASSILFALARAYFWFVRVSPSD